MLAWTKKTRRSPGLRRHIRSVRGFWSGSRWTRRWTAYAPTRVLLICCAVSDFHSDQTTFFQQEEQWTPNKPKDSQRDGFRHGTNAILRRSSLTTPKM